MVVRNHLDCSIIVAEGKDTMRSRGGKTGKEIKRNESKCRTHVPTRRRAFSFIFPVATSFHLSFRLMDACLVVPNDCSAA